MKKILTLTVLISSSAMGTTTCKTFSVTNKSYFNKVKTAKIFTRYADYDYRIRFMNGNNQVDTCSFNLKERKWRLSETSTVNCMTEDPSWIDRSAIAYRLKFTKRGLKTELEVVNQKGILAQLNCSEI